MVDPVGYLEVAHNVAYSTIGSVLAAAFFFIVRILLRRLFQRKRLRPSRESLIKVHRQTCEPIDRRWWTISGRSFPSKNA